MTVPDDSRVNKERHAEPNSARGNGSVGRKHRRVAIASSIGTLVESYDFAVYGVAAALVFPEVFFPALGPAAGVVASLATLAVTFVMRPVGAVIFGYFGDRYGRKSTLIATILGMGIATGLVGLIPSASSIGIAAPILVVVLRVLAGLAFGGEWAGAQLFATEHAPIRRRGMFAMFPQFGNAFGNVLSPATILIVSVMASQEEFISWGWRVPFLFCGIITVFALYVRLKVGETPAFETDKMRSEYSRAPLVEVFEHQLSTALRGAGVALTTFAFNYTGLAYFPGYAERTLGLSRNSALAITALAAVFYTAATVASAVISDRLGRRAVVGGSSLVGVFWSLVLFPALEGGGVIRFAVVMCVTLAIAGSVYGAVGALLPEQFPTRYRYTATSISYQLCAVVGGGVVPLLAPVIVGSLGETAFGFVLAAVCAIAAGCTFSLPERRHHSMDWAISR
jgi:MFS family permease